jgi:hypothetical protein
MWRVLGANPATKIVFGEAKGFSLLLSVLESIQADEEGSRMLRRDVLFGLDESQASSTVNPSSSLHQKPETQSHMELFTSLMHVLTVAVADMPVNRNLLHESLVSPAFKRLLLKSGLLCEQHEDKIAELLFDVALERVHSPSQNVQGLPALLHKEEVSGSFLILQSYQIPGSDSVYVLDPSQGVEKEEVYNASAIEVLLYFLLQFSFKLQMQVLIRVERLARGSARNQDCLTSVGELFSVHESCIQNTPVYVICLQ